MTTEPPSPDGSDIPLRSVREGKQLGRGGEGTVYELRAPFPGLIFKRYHGKDANGGSLKRLVDLPHTLAAEHRRSLEDKTAWPLARVTDGDAVSGFVMRKIPDRFYGRTFAGKSKARELQYLIFEPRPMWGSIKPPDIAGRLSLAREIANLIRLLHDNLLVLGDISMSNLLWVYDSAAAIFLIDCDGIRFLGGWPVRPQAATPDWEDPLSTRHGLDLDNDRYKCALAIGRVLSQSPKVHPGQSLDLLPGIPSQIAKDVQFLWNQAALPRGLRPDANNWIFALGGD